MARAAAVRPLVVDRRGNPLMSEKRRVAASAFYGFMGGMRGGYEGAGSGAALRDWSPLTGSADADSIGDLASLRARSRDLCRNAPIAAGAVQTYTTSIVGTGIRPQPQIDAELLGLSPEAAKAWQLRARKLFAQWAGTTACDVQRRLTFVDLQSVVCRSEFESGDVFVIRRNVARVGDVFATRLQLIEGDRVCNPHHLPDTPHMVGGVEFDANGAPTAFHVLNQHPGDWRVTGAATWSSVRAFGASSGEPMVLQVWLCTRPGQTRGVPRLAPVITALKQLSRYSDAEIMRAVVSTMFTAFTIAGPEDDAQGLAEVTRDGVNESVPASSASEYRLGPGTMVDLENGADVKFGDPTAPNPAFEQFVTAFLRQIGVAIEIPYEVLIKHFTASYSAARGALLEWFRVVFTNRERIVRQFCQPVYEWFITECVATGLLEAPGYLEDSMARRAWLGCIWTGDAMGSIDPLKEVNAARERIALKISNRAIETSELMGEEWDSVAAQLAREESTMKELGLSPAPAADANQTRRLGPPEEEEDLDDEEDLENETRKPRELAGVA